MSSRNAEQQAAADTTATAGGSTEINSYIASLQLERNNTKVGHTSLLQRRKTLMKDARDPHTDQKALEQEIKQVERLASLLGRRATRFDGKRSAPKVNHDLDATLVGFFDDQDENERLGDILLSGGFRTQQNQESNSGSVGEAADPRLVEKSIHAAPSALIAQQQADSDRNAADPFDKIEEMDVAESLTGSAEYLPLATYKSEEVMITGPSDNRTTQQDAERTSGKAMLSADGPELSDDDGELLAVNRSNTWRQQSSALIKEREQHGPALPTIADDEEEEEEEDWTGDPHGVVSIVANLSSPTQPRAAAAVEEYLDIMDFMNAAGETGDEFRQSSDKEDGHISSDLDGNRAATSESELDLSATDSSDSEAESDAQYLARLLQPRALTVANVAEPQSQTSLAADDGSSSTNVRDQENSDPVRVPDVPVATSTSKLGGRSTLRRNRRIVSRGGRSTGRATRAAVVKTPQSVEDTSDHSAAVPPTILEPTGTEPSGTHAGHVAGKGNDDTNRVKQTMAEPANADAGHNVCKDDGGGDSDSRPRVVGLAKLAEDAIAASSVETQQRGRRIRPSYPRSARHKALPPIPDRVARTMEVADANVAAKPAPPPLPKTERPRIPRALAEDGLTTRADIAVAVERPSSTRLFGDDSRNNSGDAPQGLRTWLQRTNILLPPTNAMSKPLPRPPGSPGRSALLVNNQLPAPESSAANQHEVASRDTVKTGSCAAGKLAPLPSSFDAPRPFSALSALPLSNSRYSNSRPASARVSPSNSNRNSVASAASAPAPASTTTPDTSSSLPGFLKKPLQTPEPQTIAVQQQQQQGNQHRSRPVTAAAADSDTALYTPVTSKDIVARATTPASSKQPSMPSPATYKSPLQQQPYGSAYTGGIYSPLSAVAGPAMLSAPPCSDAPATCANPPRLDGLVEPSAPMLLEPSAPELPNDWPDTSPRSYAFPVPVHYAHSDPMEMGFAFSPQAPADQETCLPTAPPLPPPPPSQQPPKIPEKPRPYMPDVLEQKQQQPQEQAQEPQELPAKPAPTPVSPSLPPLVPSITHATFTTRNVYPGTH